MSAPTAGTGIYAVRMYTDFNPFVFVKFGERGYYEANQEMAAQMVAEQGPALTESALAGSLFGWHCPAAALAANHAFMTSWRAQRDADAVKLSELLRP